MPAGRRRAHERAGVGGDEDAGAQPGDGQRKTTWLSGDCAPSRESSTTPTAKMHNPSVLSSREPIRSERVPLSGAAMAMIMGCAVSISPAWAGLEPRPWIR